MAFLGKIRDFVSGVLAMVLLPMIISASAISSMFGKHHKEGRQITPTEFAAFLRRVGTDAVDRGEWDEFECLRLSDSRLDAIRQRAFPFCGRPGIVDQKALNALAAEAEALPPLTE